MKTEEIIDKLTLAIHQEQCNRLEEKRQMTLTVNSKWVKLLIEYHYDILSIKAPHTVSNITLMGVQVFPSDFIPENQIAFGYLNEF